MAQKQASEALEIIRLKKGGQRFEVACYPEKYNLWKKQKITNVTDVVEVVAIFKNHSKSILPKNQDLKRIFKTTNKEEICKQILDGGKTMPHAKKEQKSESKTEIPEEVAREPSFSESLSSIQRLWEWLMEYIWPQTHRQESSDGKETESHERRELENKFKTQTDVLSSVQRSLELLRKGMLPKANRQKVLEETYQKVCKMMVSNPNEIKTFVFQVYAHFPASNMKKYRSVRDNVLLVKDALYETKLRMKGQNLKMDVIVLPAELEDFIHTVISGHGKAEIIAMVTSEEGNKLGLRPCEAYKKAIY